MSLNVKELNPTDFQNAITSQTPVLIDFWAPWCGPCRMVAPVLESIASKLGERIQIAKVNVDDYPEIAGSYQVQGIPTMILFSNGAVQDRLVGAMPEASLLNWIEARI